VLVKIRVERRYSPFLRGTTVAALAKEGLMGDSFIELSSGDRLTPPLQDDAVIPYLPATDFSATARQMAMKLDQTLNEMQKLLITLNDPHGNLQGGLKNMEMLMRDMRSTRVKLDETLTSVNRVAQETDMRKTIEDANKMINNANETIENMQQRWPFKPTDELKKEREKKKQNR
jgi:ABC-type transporter Mla subunit MlaD